MKKKITTGAKYSIYKQLSWMFIALYMGIMIYRYYCKYPWDIFFMWILLAFISPIISLSMSALSLIKEKRDFVNITALLISIIILSIWFYCMITGYILPTHNK